MTTVSTSTDRELLTTLFDAAVAGVAPGTATAAAVEKITIGRDQRVWVFAFGKAAPAMAQGAVDALLRGRHVIAGGIVVGPEPTPAPFGTIVSMAGDHPVPRRNSFAAAARIGEIAAGRLGTDVAIVLVSGGTSSMIAAPIRGLEEAELTRLFELLLTSGLEIGTMNAVRKRFTRWGAGRLALALAPAAVHCLAISDVPGDDPATIGSGPCAPDPVRVQDAVQALKDADIYDRLPPPYREHLEAVARRVIPDTPKAGHPAFAHVTMRVIANNRGALVAAATRARELGMASVEMAPQALMGDAAQRGEEIARELLRMRAEDPSGAPRCRLWGGETTVTLEGSASGASLARGGRCQELALAAARVLHDAGEQASGITLLAAGTDGRDGSTPAAGACVDAATWRTIGERGADPAAALAEHRSHAALESAGALLVTGPTGTNVMDVVIGLVR